VRARFAEYLLDGGSRELRRQGEAVHLSPKAFQLLELLLEQRPRAVSKEEVHARLWPATFVHEANLPNLVRELRAALRDDARQPRFVRTVHTHGYAFCGDAVEEPALPAGVSRPFTYRLELPGETASFGEGEHVLGRTATSLVRLRSRSVSRRHARILAHGGRATIEDLGSRNGTFVGGRRLEGPVALSDGDQIRVGSVTLTFSVAPATALTSETDVPDE
jgi:DNA-binding winged helix-turn-helix (wHTH) protein